MCDCDEITYTVIVRDLGHTHVFIVLDSRISELFAMIDRYDDSYLSEQGKILAKSCITQLADIFTDENE